MYQDPSWLEDELKDQQIDIESANLIREMLKEEEYFNNRRSEDHPQIHKKTKKWSKEEFQTLKEALQSHGFNWKYLEEALPNKSLDQIKVKLSKLDKQMLKKRKQTHNQSDENDDEMVDILSDDPDLIEILSPQKDKNQPIEIPPPVIATAPNSPKKVRVIVSKSFEIGKPPTYPKLDDTIQKNNNEEKKSTQNDTKDEPKGKPVKVKRVQSILTSFNHVKKIEEITSPLLQNAELKSPNSPAKSSIFPLNVKNEHLIQNISAPASDTVIPVLKKLSEEHLESDFSDNPKYDSDQEKFSIHKSLIQDFESRMCPEWFTKKQKKRTPERYFELRNRIIELWEEHKPRYLSKTKIKQSIPIDGDNLTAIYRIHAFLESIGAINKQAVGKRGRKQQKFILTEEMMMEPAPIAKKPKREIDPFALVSPSKDHQAPFSVEYESNVLVVVDFHAHLANTEIIGLLGGKFDDDGLKLRVLDCFPCNSTSTGMQCEMDPVSEMQARSYFEGNGLDVVGWYHSHPTFEPNPSIRDIENQANYQALFKRADNLAPFIGLIVSPYDQRNPVPISKFQTFVASDSHNGDYLLPLECNSTIFPATDLPCTIFDKLSDLLKQYRGFVSKVDLHESFTTTLSETTKFWKLVGSLENNISAGKIDMKISKSFIDKMKTVIERGFM